MEERRKKVRERERKKSNKEERGMNKIYIYIYIFFFNTSIHTVPKMEQYCSYVSKFIRFGTPHEKGFLVFSVPNVSYYSI